MSNSTSEKKQDFMYHLKPEVYVGLDLAEPSICGETKHREMSCTDGLNGSLITS